MQAYIDIILLAIITLILIFKLISILGRKDFEHPELKVKTQESQKVEPIVVMDKNLTPLDKLKLFDPNFNDSVFLENAKSAFKIILEAYAQGNTHILTDLVGIDTMKKFAYAIAKREENKQTCEINILKVSKASIENILIEGFIAEIIIKFKAETIMNIHDKNNQLIHGHLNKIEILQDIWTFRRNLKSSDPTWKLVTLEQIPFAV